MNQQMSIEDGIAARDKALENVEKNADPEYKKVILEVIKAVATENPQFCSDDIAGVMQHMTVETHDKRVIGAMMKKAQRNGWCKPLVCDHCGSVVTRRTSSKKSHASPMNYWKSLIYQPLATVGAAHLIGTVHVRKPVSNP